MYLTKEQREEIRVWINRTEVYPNEADKDAHFMNELLAHADEMDKRIESGDQILSVFSGILDAAESKLKRVNVELREIKVENATLKNKWVNNLILADLNLKILTLEAENAKLREAIKKQEEK